MRAGGENEAMMKGLQSRLGDVVKITCPHGTQIGVITSCSKYAFVDSLGLARLTDKVVCTTCGGEGNIITGSNYTFTDSLMNARVGDKEVGTCQFGCKTCNHTHNGEIVQGSPYKFVG